jgi:hypothetical protein
MAYEFQGRMPMAVGCAVGFGGYLVAAAGLTAVSPGHTAGVVVLAVIAAAIGWWMTVPGAALVGLLGWPFYSGFVAHSQGVLAVTGSRDGVIALILVAAAVVAATVRLLVTVAQRPVADPEPADIPRQRMAVEQLQYH